jgi:hypothetical protein
MLAAGEFDTTEKLLASVNAVLGAHNLFLDPLAASYLEIVTRLEATGYEAQTITLSRDIATVTAIHDWPSLETLTLDRTASGWRLAGGDLASRSIISAFGFDR